MLKYTTYQSIYNDRNMDSRRSVTIYALCSRLVNSVRCSISTFMAKMTLFKVAVFILVAMITSTGMMTVVASSPEENVPLKRVVVKQGDSLWKLAAHHKPDRMDTRIYIEAIMKANGLSGGSIQPGDLLVMPAK